MTNSLCDKKFQPKYDPRIDKICEQNFAGFFRGIQYVCQIFISMFCSTYTHVRTLGNSHVSFLSLNHQSKKSRKFLIMMYDLDARIPWSWTGATKICKLNVIFWSIIWDDHFSWRISRLEPSKLANYFPPSDMKWSFHRSWMIGFGKVPSFLIEGRRLLHQQIFRGI